MTTITPTKQTGATFTPPPMAHLLAQRLAAQITQPHPNILDPACGDGALLTAITQELDRPHYLTGYDINASYLHTAAAQLPNAQLHQQDFLTLEANPTYDLIIANPPYVRTQVLGAAYAQEIAQKFQLRGRVDLYHAFLKQMTRMLKPGGLLGVITSNRFLSTKAGASVRSYLEEHYEILEILDLGDTDLFDAAVLPAITIARKRPEQEQPPRFIRVYKSETPGETEIPSVYDLFDPRRADGNYANGQPYRRESGVVRFLHDKEHTWTMLTDRELAWTQRLEAHATGRVRDHFKVRVGIKSTADAVFIGPREKFAAVESEVVYPLLSAQDLEPWRVTTEALQHVVYPYNMDAPRRQVLPLAAYPRMAAFFEHHQEVLRARSYVTKSGRQWYELWVPQRPLLWQYPKLVFPDISPEPRFYYDEGGYIVNGNCYWIVATTKRERELLDLLQGIANSRIMTTYHDLMFRNKLYSGRRRYMTQYVENYPILAVDSSAAQTIIRLVRQMREQPDTGTARVLEDAVAAGFGFAEEGSRQP